MDKFDLNPIFVNVDKLKPYQLLDIETYNIIPLAPIRWEGHGDVVINDEEKDNHDKIICVINIQQFERQIKHMVK